jgi:hypothetical protein
MDPTCTWGGDGSPASLEMRNRFYPIQAVGGPCFAALCFTIVYPGLDAAATRTTALQPKNTLAGLALFGGRDGRKIERSPADGFSDLANAQRAHRRPQEMGGGTLTQE